jgi:hypothetical protein
MIMAKYITRAILAAFLSLLMFSVFIGCSNSDSDGPAAVETQFMVTATNLTNNQPLSPLAVVIHTVGYEGWEPGISATDGLEVLAESGDPADFLGEADGNSAVVETEAGAGVVLPGGSDSVTMTVTHSSGLLLTGAFMLVNTNDGFTGVNAGLIGDLEVGESKTFFSQPWDAGTEGNVETAATIPGPVASGEGFNLARDDQDFVAAHQGVVTQDDGLATSVLDESHRFLGPVARFVVTRTQ